MSDFTSYVDAAAGLTDDMVELRRDIHAHPELALDNPRTQGQIVEALTGLGYEISLGEGCTSVVADLTGGDGPTVLLRADTDALPMTEDTDEDFTSRVEGRAHACGHDAHTAMLLGAARLLAENRSELPGSIRLMFQPGEEGAHGAKVMIDEGVLDGVDRAFALHVPPNIPAGLVAARPGPMLARADEFRLTVTGRGGHASTPHFCTDPVPAACATVTALHTQLTREIEAFNPAVLTVAQIEAGTTTNVIPESAMVAGTIRAVSEASRLKTQQLVERVATNTAAAHGCSCDVRITPGYPVTVNHADQVALFEGVAEATLGTGHYVELPTPVMGAEDFSYVLNDRPGLMAFLGVCPDDIENSFEAPPNHSNRMRLNESAMPTGAALHVAMALTA